MPRQAILQLVTAETAGLCICDRALKCNGGHYTHTHTHARARAHICVYIYVCVNVHMYVYMCVCVCVIVSVILRKKCYKETLDTTTTGACYRSSILEVARPSSG